MEQILGTVLARHRGHLLGVEMEREDGHYVYEFELLGNDGNVREYYYDAVTGRLLKQEVED